MLRTLWDRDSARKLTTPALLDDEAVLLLLGGDLGLSGDDKAVVLEVDRYVFLFQARQLESRGDEIVIRRFMDINPKELVSSLFSE